MSEQGGQDAGSGGKRVGEQTASEAGRAEGGQEGYVLDASALLCLISGESGAERVAAVLPATTRASNGSRTLRVPGNEAGTDRPP